MKPKPLQKENRLPGLNGLRALAALSVFGVHFNQIVQFDYHIGPVSIYRTGIPMRIIDDAPGFFGGPSPLLQKRVGIDL